MAKQVVVVERGGLPSASFTGSVLLTGTVIGFIAGYQARESCHDWHTHHCANSP